MQDMKAFVLCAIKMKVTLLILMDAIWIYKNKIVVLQLKI